MKRDWNSKARFAGMLILLSLLVEAITVTWVHPVSFVLFLVAGLLPGALGIVLFLYWFLTSREA